MSGEDLKKKLESAGISQAEIARRLGVIPQSVGQALEAKDVKSGFLEDICRVFDKDISFFYSGEASTFQDANEELIELRKSIASLNEENERLKIELRIKNDPDLSTKESEVYRLWMEYMKITERMQELYKSQKEE